MEKLMKTHFGAATNLQTTPKKMLANVVNPTIPESPMLPLKWMAKSSPIH
jgi:hypothetical protein